MDNIFVLIRVVSWIAVCLRSGERSTKSNEEARNTSIRIEKLMPELILKEEVYQIVGASMEVYYQLGRGFLEPIYQEVLEIELQRRNIPFEPQKHLIVYYKGQPLKKEYIADFVCFGQIIVELKVCECLTGREEAQILNYLNGHEGWSALQFRKSGQARVETVRNIDRRTAKPH